MRALLIGFAAATVTVIPGDTVDAQNTPVITSLSPSSAVAMGSGPTVTVVGRNFGNLARDVVVRLNGDARTTTHVSDSLVRVTLHDSDIARAGTAQIIVYRQQGSTGVQSAPATFTINNPLPQFSALSPTETRTDISRTLTISGSAFAPDVIVQWKGVPKFVTRESPTQLKVYLSAADLAVAGSFSVKVINPAPGGGTRERFLRVVEPPTITGFLIGGSSNPARVWAWPSVQQFHVTSTGGPGTLWRMAASPTALLTTTWRPSNVSLGYAFGSSSSNDCGSPDPTQYLSSAVLHLQLAVVVGTDTVASPTKTDAVTVRLPWCSPIRIYTPPVWAGFPSSDVGESTCPRGVIMNGLRVRTTGSTSPTVTAIAAACSDNSTGSLVGTNEGVTTHSSNFPGAVTTVQAFASTTWIGSPTGSLSGVTGLPAAPPGWLNGKLSYDPLYARVIGGTATASGPMWTATCPSGAAPIGLHVYRGSNGRAIGLSMLCVRQDVTAP